jgi:nitrate/nitrite-specific signal transduction histidine kinase
MRVRLTQVRLRTRILVWSFVPTAVILFAVAVVAVYAYGRVTEQEAVHRDQELARLSAANLAAEINQFSLDLGSLTRQSDIAGGRSGAQEAALATAANRLSVFDAGTIILDAHGTLAAAWPRRPGDIGQDWSSRPYFAQLLRSPRPIYSDVTRDGVGGAQVVAVAVPITGTRGEFNGVLAGMFRLGATSVSALYGDIAKLRVGVSGDVYVVDGNGRVIEHPDPQFVGADLTSQRVVRRVVSGLTGAERTRDLNGRDVVAGYAPVPGTGWGLIAVENWSTLIRPFQGYRTFLLVLLVLGLLVPSLVVLLGVRRLTRPVLALTQAARQVAAGDFEHTVNITTHDELQELGEQFNEMSAELRDSYAELDKRVASRTQELATLNAVAAVVSQSLQLERILEDALGKIIPELGFAAGVAFVVPEDGQEAGLRLVTSKNLSSEVAAALAVHVPEMLERHLSEPGGQARALPVDGLASGDLATALRSAGWESAVEIPLAAKGTLFGALVLFAAERLELNLEQLASLSSLGNQIGMAVDNARLYARAEESAAAMERNRLARDLHDAVSQTLFSASLIAEILPRVYERDPEQGKERLEELRQLTRGALAEMRTLLLELRPAALAEAKLPDLLRQLGEAVAGRSRIPIDVEVDTNVEIPAEVSVALYRIAQEALNNVAKHSGAEHASVRLHDRGDELEAGALELVVADDGSGFDPDVVRSGSLGLGIMAERAEAIDARLEVQSRPGEGTRVRVLWHPDSFSGRSDVEIPSRSDVENPSPPGA